MARKLVLLFLLSACNNNVCSRHSDCSHDQTCSTQGLCVGAPDAAVASTVDAPAPDAGVDGGP